MKNTQKEKEGKQRRKKKYYSSKPNRQKKIVLALWTLLAVSFCFAVYKNFTAMDIHTIQEKIILEKEIVDTHNIENFVKNFAHIYYSWEQTADSMDRRQEALKRYLTEELQVLNRDVLQKDIPVCSSVEEVQIWQIQQEGKQQYQVTYTVEQRILEDKREKTVHSAYQVMVYVDEEENLVLIKNPTLCRIPGKSSYKPKTKESNGTIDLVMVQEINEFLNTFFKIYPTATEKELSYYVEEGALKPVEREYLFSELIQPIYRKNKDQVLVSVTVKYLDPQTKAVQLSQFDLTLEKNHNWLIVR